MFKLTVVGGPGQGKSYSIKDGENSVGRVAGNDIIVASQNVSKKHCVLVVDNTGVTVKDAGSSNGTFVNGVLTKLRKLVPGDRVSVGDVVLELSKLAPAKPKITTQSYNNVIPLEISGASFPVAGTGNIATGMPGMAGSPAPVAADLPPQDLKDKVKYYFEKHVINFVYNLNEKHEWRVMMVAMFVLLVVGTTVLSVNPVLSRVSEKLTNEAAGRALLLAREIVDRNSSYIFERMESKTDVSYVEKEPGVISAYLLDLEGRVLAPGRKLNQYLTAADEASFSAYAREKFNSSETIERVVRTYGENIAVAIPLRVFSNDLKRNIVAAAGVVFFDRTNVLFDSGTEGLFYIQALILASILGVLIYFSLYKLTLRPIETLNLDVDNVLKGSGSIVEKKYKMEEINPLIDVINAALQRASQGGGGGQSLNSGTSPEEYISLFKVVYASLTNAGILLFGGDKRIQYVSPFMEEISGIHNDGAVGSQIQTSARDAAFVAFVEDIFSKANSLSMGSASREEFEFSGNQYQMDSFLIGSTMQPILYVLIAQKKES